MGALGLSFLGGGALPAALAAGWEAILREQLPALGLGGPGSHLGSFWFPEVFLGAFCV